MKGRVLLVIQETSRLVLAGGCGTRCRVCFEFFVVLLLSFDVLLVPEFGRGRDARQYICL
jgi:hypothetical protein